MQAAKGGGQGKAGVDSLSRPHPEASGMDSAAEPGFAGISWEEVVDSYLVVNHVGCLLSEIT